MISIYLIDFLKFRFRLGFISIAEECICHHFKHLLIIDKQVDQVETFFWSEIGVRAEFSKFEEGVLELLRFLFLSFALLHYLFSDGFYARFESLIEGFLF